jgi:hypothetical protein
MKSECEIGGADKHSSVDINECSWFEAKATASKAYVWTRMLSTADRFH